MYALRAFLDRNPIQIAAAVISGVNFAVVMEWIAMTDKQISALSQLLVIVGGLFIIEKTVNKAKLEEAAAAANPNAPRRPGEQLHAEGRPPPPT